MFCAHPLRCDIAKLIRVGDQSYIILIKDAQYFLPVDGKWQFNHNGSRWGATFPADFSLIVHANEAIKYENELLNDLINYAKWAKF